MPTTNTVQLEIIGLLEQQLLSTVDSDLRHADPSLVLDVQATVRGSNLPNYYIKIWFGVASGNCNRIDMRLPASGSATTWTSTETPFSSSVPGMRATRSSEPLPLVVGYLGVWLVFSISKSCTSRVACPRPKVMFPSASNWKTSTMGTDSPRALQGRLGHISLATKKGLSYLRSITTWKVSSESVAFTP